MHKLHELKDMLCEELEEYGSKGKLDVGSLDVVDKLAHAIKNIDKIIAAKDDEEYSHAMGGRYDMSYARGRGARRDAMGRYSREGYSRAEDDFRSEMEDLIHDAPNDHIRQKMQALLREI